MLEALISRLILRERWRLEAEIQHSRKSYIFELSKVAEGNLVTPSNLKLKLTARTSIRIKPKASSISEIITVDDMASKLGITEAEVRQRLELSGSRYVDLGDVIVTPKKLKALNEAPANAPDMRLSTLSGILRRLGCRRPLPVPEALGYAVEWAEDRGRSEVYRLRRCRTTP